MMECIRKLKRGILKIFLQQLLALLARFPEMIKQKIINYVRKYFRKIWIIGYSVNV
jgi:hypothetical protein